MENLQKCTYADAEGRKESYNFDDFMHDQMTAICEPAIDLILALNPKARPDVEMVMGVIENAACVVGDACFPYYDDGMPCCLAGSCKNNICLYKEMMKDENSVAI